MTTWIAEEPNLGCGGPHIEETVVAARRWAVTRADQAIDVLFVQEAPRSLDEDLDPSYECFVHAPGRITTYSCRSLLAFRRGSGLDAEPFALRTAAYHGSYLTAARVRLPQFGPITFVSVHASPSKVEDRYRELWIGELPPARAVAKGILWDADLVARDPCGAHGQWSGTHRRRLQRGTGLRRAFRRTLGVQYFAGLAEAGLIDATYGRWGGAERPTRGDFQDDHIIATLIVDALIVDPVVVESPGVVGGQDHRCGGPSGPH